MSKYTEFPWLPKEPNGTRMGWSVGPAWLGSRESMTNDDRHLIAAAPDLLEALERLLPYSRDAFWITPHEGEFIWQAALERAECAIAKAKGESSGLPCSDRGEGKGDFVSEQLKPCPCGETPTQL